MNRAVTALLVVLFFGGALATLAFLVVGVFAKVRAMTSTDWLLVAGATVLVYGAFAVYLLFGGGPSGSASKLLDKADDRPKP